MKYSTTSATHSRPTTRRTMLALLAGAIGLAAAPAFAQGTDNFPNRAVTIVVPFPAGGATDITAHGVHLGQEDLETTDLKAIQAAGLRLGVSTHDDMEIEVALAAKPSYIALGHVFPTQTKQMPSAPQGLTQLASHSKRLADYPTVAIGGISLERAPAVLATGVGSIAVVSAITHAADWQAATAQLLDIAGAGDE